MEFYNKDIGTVINELKTNESVGLNQKEVDIRQKKFGQNELNQDKSDDVLKIFFSQFKDFMILILFISALVSLFVSYINGEGEYYDFLIIIGIVLLNGIIGTFQECNAEKAIEALKDLTSPLAVVIRNGKKKSIDSKNLTIGDIVILKTGDIAPADIRLIDSTEISCEESALTGETLPVYKNPNLVIDGLVPISEIKNMVFSGSPISSGYGKGVVTNIGMNTQIGKIAEMLGKEKSPKTPLQNKLDKTGKILGLIVVCVCMIIFILGIFKDIPVLEMLLIAISLAVAAIPEGLTAVVTIVLSMGVKRMAERKAIVRKLPAVETLGSVSVICSDKTGTLTENKMTVAKISNAMEFIPIENEESRLILGLGSLCNNSEKAPNGKYMGMPTETAIIKAFEREAPEFISQFPRIGEIPFTSKRKIMSTIHKSGDAYLVVTKGAPDYIIKMCEFVMIKGNKIELSSVLRDKILSRNRELAQKALRVLAVAKKECDELSDDDKKIESGLTFCGLIGIEDPPRKEAKKAVAECKKAGIIPVMITGDQTPTALAVAERIGIYQAGNKYMTGNELSKISVEELSKKIEDYRVFTRVSSEDKVKIVKAFQSKNELVAMTGDGVNDAPALKVSDIGCAMGKNGTEVAKSAADMILTDDNFSTIVEAVKEGRTIFANIRKTVHFLFSCNMGEILLIVLAFLLGLPVPLLATQILWVNLVTDSFPALALGATKAEKNIMDNKFTRKELLDKSMCISMILEGAFIGVMSTVAFIIGRNFFDVNINNPVIGRTMCFAVLCLSQLMHSFNISSDLSIFSKNRQSNKHLTISAVFCSLLLIIVIITPAFSVAFNTISLNFTQWFYVIMLSLCPVVVSELEKLKNRVFSK